MPFAIASHQIANSFSFAMIAGPFPFSSSNALILTEIKLQASLRYPLASEYPNRRFLPISSLHLRSFFFKFLPFPSFLFIFKNSIFHLLNCVRLFWSLRCASRRLNLWIASPRGSLHCFGFQTEFSARLRSLVGTTAVRLQRLGLAVSVPYASNKIGPINLDQKSRAKKSASLRRHCYPLGSKMFDWPLSSVSRRICELAKSSRHLANLFLLFLCQTNAYCKSFRDLKAWRDLRRQQAVLIAKSRFRLG